jgi:hypothetical protein
VKASLIESQSQVFFSNFVVCQQFCPQTSGNTLPPKNKNGEIWLLAFGKKENFSQKFKSELTFGKCLPQKIKTGQNLS